MNENEQNGETIHQNGNGGAAGFVPEEAVSFADARVAAVENDLAIINRKLVNQLAQIGVDADKSGLLKIASGALIVSMAVATEMVQEVLKIAQAPKCKDRTKLNAAFAIAGLVKSIQGCATSVKADGLAATSTPTKPRIKRVLQMPAA